MNLCCGEGQTQVTCMGRAMTLVVWSWPRGKTVSWSQWPLPICSCQGSCFD